MSHSKVRVHRLVMFGCRMDGRRLITARLSLHRDPFDEGFVRDWNGGMSDVRAHAYDYD